MIDVVGSPERERSLLDLVRESGLPIDLPAHLQDVAIRWITDDSREVVGNSCFVAVQGDQHDGCDFIRDAVDRGAVAIVSDRPIASPAGVPVIRVADARSALARLAAAWYGFGADGQSRDLKLIGVTGTNGKTTTATLLHSILQQAGHPTAMLGTIHYDLLGEVLPAPWTTPPPVKLSELLSRAAGHGATHAVIEVSSHALSQRRCDGHRFDVAVFTNLSGEHLDYHGNPDAYADAKKRLFDMLDDQAVAVVNADDNGSVRITSSCPARPLKFGLNRKADVTAKIQSLTIDGSRFTLCAPSGSFDVALPLIGRHNVLNALAAATAAIGLGIDAEQIRSGLEGVELVTGRLQRVDTGARGFALLVDYAHTDDALGRALTALKPMTRRRLICVFGCGGDRDRSKRPRMALAVAEVADIAIVTSDNPRSEDPMAIINEILAGFTGCVPLTVEVEPDRRKAIERAVALAGEGDTVLIAGKGHEDYQIIGDQRLHFDDVEVATLAVTNTTGCVA
jgi:UDP-N-acetylmuramoyl-L-alanyl-D-glutamate--2,6-diaminopimelate ligase